MSYKKFYQHFLRAHEGKLHMACHSHHFWPDITRQATLDYWDDSAKLSDHKWEYFFSQKIPALQRHIAKRLNLSDPEQIVFAPNTHDLLIRLLSLLDFKTKPKILTTDSEFHSFSRQITKLEEDSIVEVERLKTESETDLLNEIKLLSKSKSFDFIFISQTFFNSGRTITDLDQLVQLFDDHAIIVIDGYHSYMTKEISLKQIENRVYFISGHYKYAQGGEGLCFMTCPPSEQNPKITGWFAQIDALASKQGKIAFPAKAARFWGSTMDFTPVYRSLAVYDLFDAEGLTTTKIHRHILDLQNAFLDIISSLSTKLLDQSMLLNSAGDAQFLAFDLGSQEKANNLEKKLRQHDILTDSRGSTLRFGFSLYQEIKDFDKLRVIEQF
ncbi:MAG: selenocysteine lyase [Halobacteriovorax sp.]|nr:selenocysteine lyase [Halobacteriovorax sp.]|tara:strand:+ start:597 stop:1748 length:1152 start_codon:yes stop_codon:yes gene_type:complete